MKIVPFLKQQKGKDRRNSLFFTIFLKFAIQNFSKKIFFIISNNIPYYRKLANYEINES